MSKVLRVAALVFVATMFVAAAARAEPGQTTPTTKPSVQFETAMPDDDDTVVRPGPRTTPTPKVTLSPSASPPVQPYP